MISSLFPFASAQAEDELQLENWPVFRVGPSGSILDPSAVMGEDGIVHLVYLSRDPSYSDWYLRPNYLRYANFSQGQWEHADLQAGFFSFADIALDDDGSAHILCAVRWNTTVDIVYWNNANGTWESEDVAQFNTEEAENVDMAVDADGKVHAVLGVGEGPEGKITYYYANNSAGDWQFVPIHANAEWAELSCSPDIELDQQGRAHIAYVKVDDYVWGEWDSGDWTIQLITRDGDSWTDEKNISLPSRCNSLSLQLDDQGYEHILYQCVTSSVETAGPVRLAQWNASGLSWYGISDGSWLCELHLTDDGERFMFMHEDNYFFVGENGGGAIDRSVRIPAGTYPASGDPGDLTDDGTVILLFDMMSDELLLYMPGSESMYPEIAGWGITEDGVLLTFENVDPAEPVIMEYHVYRTAIWGEVSPITVDFGVPFIVPANDTGMMDATFEEIPVWTLLNYRLSVITDEGAEYIGEMETFTTGDAGNEGLNTSGFWLIVASIVIIALVAAVALILLWRR